jgi:hypothetical protein
MFISKDPLFEKYPWMSPYAYCSNNPVNRIDPTGMSDGWIDDGNGNVFWDNNTNSQAEFAQNYANKPGYSYVSDPSNPNSYTLPSGEGQLVMNTWNAPNDIENGVGGLHVNMTFVSTDKNAEVGWLQTFSSNIINVNSGNLYDVLPENASREVLDGYGVQQSSDISLARYFNGSNGFGSANATLDDGPLRAKNPGATSDVSFNAQSTALINGKRAVSVGWGFAVKSSNSQITNTPTILKITSGFHNNAINSLSNKILSR